MCPKIFILLLLIVSCNKPGEDTPISCEKEFLLEEGIYVEKIDSFSNDKNPFNLDNTIFTPGSTYFYTYQYYDAKGQRLYPNNLPDWQLVRENINDTIKIAVLSELMNKDYHQTLISYTYPPHSFFSVSGVIENGQNVWMHPPRDGLFKILAINPFPFIMKPFKKGTKWTWDLNLGDHWGDARWKLWEGNITNEYNYEISELVKVTSKLGKINCFMIRSSARSRIGHTYLTSYFSPLYGFVKLEYTNIDQSKIIMELVKRTKKNNGQITKNHLFPQPF